MKKTRGSITVSEEEWDISKPTIPVRSISGERIDYLVGLYVRIPLRQRQWMEEFSKTSGISLAEIVRSSLNDYVDKKANQKEQ